MYSFYPTFSVHFGYFQIFLIQKLSQLTSMFLSYLAHMLEFLWSAPQAMESPGYECTPRPGQTVPVSTLISSI